MRSAATNACVRLSVATAVLCSEQVWAQQATRSLGMTNDPVALPGLGRIVFAFIVVAALAIGAVMVLRRFGPQLGRGSLFAPAGSMRVLERLQLSADLSVHLVQTGRGKVLITAHRHSIAVVMLDTELHGTTGGGQS